MTREQQAAIPRAFLSTGTHNSRAVAAKYFVVLLLLFVSCSYLRRVLYTCKITQCISTYEIDSWTLFCPRVYGSYYFHFLVYSFNLSIKGYHDELDNRGNNSLQLEW